MRKSYDIATILGRYSVEPSSGCWIWSAYKNRRGYGVVSHNGRLWKAHRFFYHYLVEPIDADGVICHRCDNPSCVNPAHLFMGSQRDNLLDCIAKGRARRRDQRGENNHCAKLTAEQVRHIRRHETGTQREIAARYGVTQTVISDVLRRKSFAGIE